ncbi:MAG: hypothetical protein JWQ25_2472 [Daejeonella sp.]|nr:hypothetical protein [Daejeonella sp.]
MDYLGGTYISQVESQDKEQAMMRWIEKLEVDQVDGFSHEDRDEIIKKGFEEDDPSPLNGLSNVWHFLVDTKKGSAYVNFVNTVKGSS